jgi:hypothetical protein
MTFYCELDISNNVSNTKVSKKTKKMILMLRSF